MGHHPEPPRTRIKELNTLGRQYSEKISAFNSSVIQGKIDNIGLDRFGIQNNAGQAGNTIRQDPCIGMILLQPVNHSFQCYNTSCGNDPRLAHAAAQSFSYSPGLINKILTAANNRTNRCS